VEFVTCGLKPATGSGRDRASLQDTALVIALMPMVSSDALSLRLDPLHSCLCVGHCEKQPGPSPVLDGRDVNGFLRGLEAGGQLGPALELRH